MPPDSSVDFKDRAHKPVNSEISNVLGTGLSLWNDVVEFMEKVSGARADLAYYGKKLGWAIRYRKGSKTLLSMYPAKGSFTAQIVIPSKDITRAKELTLGTKTKKSIESAYRYPEGIWVYLEVSSRKDVEDAKRLLELKIWGVCGASAIDSTSPDHRSMKSCAR